MERTRLVMGLAAVFAGLTVVLTVTALAYQPFLLLIALPFGATAGLLWYHATGRLHARLTAEAWKRRQQNRTRGSRDESHRSRAAGFGAGPRETGGAGAWQRRARQRYHRQRAAASESGADAGAQPDPHGLSRREAYDILGLSPDASADDIRRAYRERAKETHPDTDSGDEASFKRINRAYERLTE